MLRDSPPSEAADLLVGFEHSDDAAVWRLDEGRALVSTVDFITPIVDDPYVFGQIAAANSLSDVYAMGGRPIFALSVVGFPSSKLPLTVLKEILRGGADKAREAGAAIVGGHTVEDQEIKYGLSVTGLVHPQRYLPNSSAKPGDRLFLTKPVGVGIVTTALKAGKASEAEAEESVRVMRTLNDGGCRAMLACGASSATDVTGFALMGHAFEMARASQVTLEIDSGRVPVVAGARTLARRGYLTGADARNRTYLGTSLEVVGPVPEDLMQVFFDAQTSGGLLIAVPERAAEELARTLAMEGCLATAEIGRVLAFTGKHVRVR